jgi:hypothetical protein
MRMRKLFLNDLKSMKELNLTNSKMKLVCPINNGTRLSKVSLVKRWLRFLKRKKEYLSNYCNIKITALKNMVDLN